MHDSADLESRGVPTVFIATEPFVDGAQAQAKALGFEHSAVYVEHPIQDRTAAEMLDIADQAFDALVAQLVKKS